jgi:MYXO-CTERM domain-containing protein
MRYYRLFFVCATLVLAMVSPMVRGDVALFSDNFNVSPGTGSTDSANYQFNAAGRQNGLAAPLQYTQSPSADDSHHHLFTAPTSNLGQPLRLSADSAVNNTFVSPNANFAQVPFGAGNFTISFDVDPNDPRDSASASASWLGLSFGGSAQGIAVDGAADHVGLLLRGSGAYRLFDGANTVTLGGGDLPGATGGGGQFTNVTVSVSDPDGNPFDGHGTATVVLSSNATGVFAVYSRPDFSGNYLTFESQSTDGQLSVSYIDNLSITAAPEPGGLTLAGVCMIGLLRRRRRSI